MKLVFTDNQKNRKVLAEGDDFGQLMAALIEHRKSMFVYGGEISLPGKMEPGSAYVVAHDTERGMTYTVEADAPVAKGCSICNSMNAQ